MGQKESGPETAGGSSPDDWRMTDLLHAEQGKGDPFAAAIRATRMPMIITDPRQADNPIVFANDAFLKLTGYERHEIVGHNCRFLQGPDSDRSSIAALREAIEQRQDIHVELLNYRKDGSQFWNSLFLSPVINEAGELQFFFASQLDVTEQRTATKRLAEERKLFEEAVQDRTSQLQAALDAQDTLLHEVDHRVKNNLQMVSSLIAMQSRTIDDEKVRASLRAMLARVEALGTVHRRLYQSKDVGHFDVSEFVRDLITDLVEASGRPGLRTEFDLQAVVVPAERATPIALIINELVTNALKHAFGDAASSRQGTLGAATKLADGAFRIEIYDDGPGMPATREESSFGTRLIKSLARQLRADITWMNSQPGTRVAIKIPMTEPSQNARSLTR